MITQKIMPSAEYSDAELVARSLAGDRDAFSRIVSRYQTLVCSLAYSRIGNLGQSEDVAQETFITAWKHLRLLREPARLRAWLCGIVRNRIYKSLRREGREPAHAAEPLEIVHDAPASEALPSEHAVSREEEAILWRSLEKIPEIYREPLILFYREHQSVEAVATELELSEDAVKQRLARGRRLLQSEVHAFVENTLRRTAPSPAFSGMVLAALPAGPTAVAGASAVGKGAIAAKQGLLAAWFAPIIGILGGITAHWLIIRAAPSERERQVKKAMFISVWVFVLAWCIPGLQGMRALGHALEWSPQTFFRAMAGFWWIYAMVLATLSVVVFRRVAAIRQEGGQSTGTSDTAPRPGAMSWIVVVIGVHLAFFSWLIALALWANDRAWAGLIAGVMLVLAVWNLVGVGGKKGVTGARAVAGHQALIWGIILVILNCRLETWAASFNGISVAEMHRLLPVWIIPLLSCALVAWVGLLLAMTKRRVSSGTAS